MTKHPLRTQVAATLLAALFPLLLSAGTVVRMETVEGNIDIELTDDLTPLTVQNFLNYVRDGDYDGTFIHRRADDFVLQGGGWIFNPNQPPEEGDGLFIGDGVTHIATDPPVINEFDRLTLPVNVSGTIAMAKVSGDPDSATSEWFFNLANNAAGLDTQNGGFTTFGQVVDDDSLKTISNITNDAFTTINAIGQFSLLPLRKNFVAGNEVQPENLVLLNRVTELYRVLPGPPDFGLVQFGTIAQLVVTLENLSATALQVGTVAGMDDLDSPFAIVQDNCSPAAPLGLNDTCTITIQFTASAEGTAQDSFDLPLTGGDIPGTTVTVRAEGSANDATIRLAPPNRRNFRLVQVNTPATRDVIVSNQGASPLALPAAAITITGADAAEFSQTNDCDNASLAFLESCTISVTFQPASEAAFAATLNISSSDPDRPVASLDLAGEGATLEPDISVQDTLEFGDQLLNAQLGANLVVTNSGNQDLMVNEPLTFSGNDADEFSVLDNACAVVTPGNNCTITIGFAPVAPGGPKSAQLTIPSNDPDTPAFVVALTGSGAGDADGVPDAVEDLAPNGGDGNGDGVPDREQSNVSSLPGPQGRYVTVEAPASTELAGVAVIENPSPFDTPTGLQTFSTTTSISFAQGFLAFTINNVTEPVAVKLILPPGEEANFYFKFGLEPLNPFFSHWYPFLFDGQTGAVFSGNTITLHFVDGRRGDGDLQVNGRIVDPGAPALVTLSANSGGGGGGCTLTRRTVPAIHALEWWFIAALGIYLGIARRRHRTH